jgi:hypothetical protein
VLEKALAFSDISPGLIGVPVSAYAHAGRRAGALKLPAELKRRKQAGYAPAGAFVSAYLRLGERDQGLASLGQGCDERSATLQFLSAIP